MWGNERFCLPGKAFQMWVWLTGLPCSFYNSRWRTFLILLGGDEWPLGIGHDAVGCTQLRLVQQRQIRSRVFADQDLIVLRLALTDRTRRPRWCRTLVLNRLQLATITIVQPLLDFTLLLICSINNTLIYLIHLRLIIVHLLFILGILIPVLFVFFIEHRFWISRFYVLLGHQLLLLLQWILELWQLPFLLFQVACAFLGAWGLLWVFWAIAFDYLDVVSFFWIVCYFLCCWFWPLWGFERIWYLDYCWSRHIWRLSLSAFRLSQLLRLLGIAQRLFWMFDKIFRFIKDLHRLFIYKSLIIQRPVIHGMVHCIRNAWIRIRILALLLFLLFWLRL